MKKIYFFNLLLLSLFNAISAKTFAQHQWRSVGPYVMPVDGSPTLISGQGKVMQIKFDPINHNRIYAISNLSAWVSDDNAEHWKILGTDNLPYLTQMASICIDHTDNKTLYLGGGESGLSGPGTGVWKSTDGGATFQPANKGMILKNGKIGVVKEILMSPTDRNTLVAATFDGIYRTTDGGANWTLVTPADKVTDMQFAPEEGSSTIYAVSQINGNFYKSTDMGQTWGVTTITTELINSSGNITSGYGARVAVSKADPNVVYVAFLGSNSSKGGVIYRSTDRGASFTMQKGDVSPNLAGYSAEQAGQGDYNFDIAVDPNNADKVYVCAHVVWGSTDGGVSWAQTYNTGWQRTMHTDMHALRFNPYNTSQLFCVNDGGVYVSTDNGLSWTPKTRGMINTEFYNMGNSPISKYLIGGGTQDNGELYYKDGVWYNNTGGDERTKYAHDNFTDNFYYTDYGMKRNVKKSGNGPKIDMYVANYAATDRYAFSYFDLNQAFLGQKSIYRSNDVQNTNVKPTWTKIFDKTSLTTAIATSPVDPNKLYVLSQDRTFHRCKYINDATPIFEQVANAPRPASGNLTTGALAVLKNGVIYMASDGYVWRSANEGETWDPVGAGPVAQQMNSQNVLTLVADTLRANIEAVYAHTKQAVYYKDNTMSDWSFYSDNLPGIIFKSAMDIYYDPINKENSVLRVSTYGRGIWENYLAGSNPDQPNQAPIVNITSIGDGMTLNTNQAIKLQSYAADAGGNVAKVEYYQNGTLIGESSFPPYSVPFTVPNTSGNLIITAVATDDEGLSTVSAPVNITLKEPWCSSSPLIPQGDLKVRYADSQQGVGAAPELNHASDKAIDNSSLTYWSTQSDAPVPSFPHEIQLDLGATYSVNQFKYLPVSFNGDGRVKDYEIYVSMDGTQWGTPVAKGAFDNTMDEKLVAFGDKKGRYLRFKAISGTNDVQYVTAVELNVGGCLYNDPPVVTITAPTANQKFNQNTDITITATATDVGGSIAKVEFFDGATKIGQVVAQPYTFTFKTTVGGTHSLRVVATDNLGAKASSSTINVIVTDGIGPVVSTLPGALDATLACSDAAGLATALAMAPVATDNKTVNPVRNVVSDITVTGNEVEFVRTRVWNFTDEDGNVSNNFTQVIKVTDKVFPVLTATDQVHPNFVISEVYTVPAITSTDNCGIKTLTYEITGATTRSGNGPDASGNFNVGQSTIVWNAFDKAGNVSTIQTVVTIDPPANRFDQTINFPALTTKTYGDASFDLTGTASSNLSLSYSSSDASIASISGNKVTIRKAGTVTITASQGGNAVYKPVSVSQILTIGKANLTVSADNKSKAYGAFNPALTVSYSGFVNGDNASSLTTAATATTNATSASAAGTYAITASGAASSNYTFAYQNGNLTVDKASLIVSADNKSKTYGAANPALTVSYSGFVNGENVSSLTSAATASTTATAASAAGTHAITVGGAASSNYTFVYQNGILTIGKAELTANADNKQMCQGSLPTFTINYSGFVNGDSPASLQTAPSVNTTANAASVAGTYSLTPTGGVSNNYNFNYVNGSLTINASPQLSISSNKPREIVKGDFVELKAEGLASTFEWQEAAGIQSVKNSAILTVQPMQTTTYVVRGYNASGCYTEQSYTIDVADKFKKDISNVLTPNGDGRNDKWVVRNIEFYPNNVVKIFNKVGRLIYLKKGYLNEWDGTFNGTKLQEGTYYYVVDLGDGSEPLKGFISIVRDLATNE
ncbi:MBG domain-containing protein [Solitalea lacus]|uniref:MBG domain-containing protein n=1 Tax=Solitalea lacus TaxID=2911172 RepID=UPI001EDB0735|nr:MBG domain-containing protein [Solitalea lacus]UKJ08571.1 gliding motility-associated C-terminal domain-containing protein [Solitalea lacus]